MTTLTRRVQGIPDAFCTRGLVCKYVQRNAHERNRYRRSNPAFPAQWLYGLCRALPGERIRLVTVACGSKVSPNPVGLERPPQAWHQQRVSGPHGFTVHRSAVRLHAASSLTENHPAIAITRPTLPRPPHPAPT